MKKEPSAPRYVAIVFDDRWRILFVSDDETQVRDAQVAAFKRGQPSIRVDTAGPSDFGR